MDYKIQLQYLKLKAKHYLNNGESLMRNITPRMHLILYSVLLLLVVL